MLYNPPWVHYAYNRMLRRQGAVEAERHGAVAALLRSVSPYSLSTPHTGATDPAGIPFAAITHEDADLLARLAGRGHRVVVKLYMEAQLREPAVSRNIIAELPGRERPDELVVMGGHIDSWDVGAGVLDDAGGAFVAWEALRLMRRYDIRPRRTVRVVFWTVRRGGTWRHARGPPRHSRALPWHTPGRLRSRQNEEIGATGADVYRANRLDELRRTSFALEADAGIFSYVECIRPIMVGRHVLNAPRTLPCFLRWRAMPQAHGHRLVGGRRGARPRGRDWRAIPRPARRRPRPRRYALGWPPTRRRWPWPACRANSSGGGPASGAWAAAAGGGGVDILPLCLAGVPCAGLRVSNGARDDKTDVYYNYHHTAADSITHMRRDEVNKCVAAMAAWAYGVADLPEMLPRLRDVRPTATAGEA